MRKKVWDMVNRVSYPYTACIIDNQLVGFGMEFPESPNINCLALRKERGGEPTKERWPF